MQISSCLSFRPTLTAYRSLLHYHPPCVDLLFLLVVFNLNPLQQLRKQKQPSRTQTAAWVLQLLKHTFLLLSIFVTWVLVFLWFRKNAADLKCPYVIFSVLYEFHFCSELELLPLLFEEETRVGLKSSQHTTQGHTGVQLVITILFHSFIHFFGQKESLKLI